MKYVIKNLENNLYYNSNLFEFSTIDRATLYEDIKEVNVRLTKLGKGYYTVIKVLVKN